ncbi:isochorismatase family protein [Oceanicella sp. SM1341]|uniref:isochorismatase family protein n=1 Tax=Oceanicella sp. SM1341 TaxID=1548889 RepID=UPI000E53BF48|nr:isochorismatase family protein [Oceanicella sp. SM1341]
MTQIETNPRGTGTGLRLPSRPEPLLMDPAETAIVVVDMQNAYASPGGYLDHAGLVSATTPGVIENCVRVIEAGRAAGMTILYFQNGWDPDYVEAGGPGSPNWHKSNALRTMRARPELQGKLLARGGWDHALIERMQPAPGEIVMHKPRYSGVFNTGFDSQMRARGIRNLVFCGIATNVCVESTLRDCFHLEYFCVLLEDAAGASGPEFMQAASVFNVEAFFGWVSNTADFTAAVAGLAAAQAAE